MASLIVLIALNAAGIAAALALRRSRRPRLLLGRLLAVLVTLLVVTGPLALGITLSGAFRAVEGDAIDPGQKARVLAEGISAAMNGLAFGVVAFLVPSALTLVLFLRTPQARPIAPPTP